MKMELDNLNSLIEEINYLKKRSELLDKILNFYDQETMTFVIPNKWENIGRMSEEMKKTCPKSPRHLLNKQFIELLPFNEHFELLNHTELYKTLADD